MKITIALVLAATTTLASAGSPTVNGDKAQRLMRALKFTGVKPTVKKTTTTYKVATVDCVSLNETEDGLGQIECTGLKLKDAAAAYLSDAMIAAGLPGGEGGGHSNVTATDLTCVLDSSQAAPARWSCSYTK